MNMTPQASALARLIAERREDYAGLSRLLGRNPSYIQQFIKRGTPRKLDENDRATLARYFGVSEAVLSGTDSGQVDRDSSMIRVPRIDVGASAGHGAIAESESATSHIAFDPRWLRQLCQGGAGELSFIRVQGDSMAPTLADGDEILVDQSDAAERLRDGIYVLRRDDALMVKRLAINPSNRRITIRSDNASYQDWPDCDPATLDIIGRVVWAGRKVT